MNKLAAWSPLITQSLVDDLFGSLSNSYNSVAPYRSTVQIPINVIQNENQFEVSASVPGISADNIEVTLDQRTLTIEGIANRDKDVEGSNYLMNERVSGSFRRSIRLPKAVEAESATSLLKDGELRITFPLKNEEKVHRLDIQSA